ncbi:MAG: Maf family protein [Balneolales bacterium]
MKTIILASASPRRKRLLEQINLKFHVAPQNVTETIDTSVSPEEFALATAGSKAEKAAPAFPDALILGADTIVVLDGEVLGKPESEKHAHAMLGKLSGKTHTVITAVVMLITDRDGKISSRKAFSGHTEVTFSRLDDVEIRDYIRTGSPLDKAGAYGIQDDWGSVFVSNINGDYYNVVGFPLHRFYRTLKAFSPDCLPKASSGFLQ